MTALIGPDSTPNPSGNTWGDFEIGGILGQGGMGAVFSGRQISLDRPVAIKVLPAHLSQDEQFVKRFDLEAKAVAKLSSTNIIQVYGAGQHQGSHYFAMEFVQGKDLSERIKSGFRPDHDEVLKIMIQAARGLADAGDAGLVHRDIKPGNLMMTDDGRVKIMDFGLVRTQSAGTELTMAGTVMGTVNYFSPEQGRGETCDQRTDLYALGVVFYELLTGQLPFSGNDATSVIYQHIHAEPTLPREIDESIPEAFQAIVLKCMMKDADDRYADAHQLLNDLELVQGGQQPSTAFFDPELLRTGATLSKNKRFKEEKKSGPVKLLVALVLVSAAGAGGWFTQEQWLPQVKKMLAGPVPPAFIADVERALEQGDQARAHQAIAKIQDHDPSYAELPKYKEQLEALRVLAQQQSSERAVREAWHTADERLFKEALVAARLPEERREYWDAQAQVFVTIDKILADAEGSLNRGEPLAAQKVLDTLPKEIPSALRDPIKTTQAVAQRMRDFHDAAERALLAGNYTSAADLFRESIRDRNNSYSVKGIEIVSLCQEFEGALEKDRTEKANEILDRIERLVGASGASLLAGLRGKIDQKSLLAAGIAAVSERNEEAVGRIVRQLGDSADPVVKQWEAEKLLMSVESSVADKDLTKARTVLASLQEHPAAGVRIQRAERAIDEAGLEAAEKEKRAAEREAKWQQEADSIIAALAAENVDLDAVSQQIAAFREKVGSGHGLTGQLSQALQVRSDKESIQRTLGAVFDVVRKDSEASLNDHMQDIDLRARLLRLAEQDQLIVSYDASPLQPSEEGTYTTQVAITCSFALAPERTTHWSVTMQRQDHTWHVINAERISQNKTEAQ